MFISAWQIQIQGWASDLEHLARHFTATSTKVVKDDRGDTEGLEAIQTLGQFSASRR